MLSTFAAQGVEASTVSPDAVLGAVVVVGLALLSGLWKLATMLAEVRSQVRHNGGDSLKDNAKDALTVGQANAARLTETSDRLVVVEGAVGNLRTLAEAAALAARLARVAAVDAHEEAKELSQRMAEASELGMVQRGLIDTSLERLSSEMDRRTALFAELGGPNLMPQDATVVVVPHTHHVPDTTGASETGEGDG